MAQEPGSTAQLVDNLIRAGCRLSKSDLEEALYTLEEQSVPVQALRLSEVTKLLYAMDEYRRVRGATDPRGAAERVYAAEPPPDWLLYSQRAFERYTEDQRRMCAIFDLDAPLSTLEEAAALLEAAAEIQQETGTKQPLLYTAAEDGKAHRIDVWSGPWTRRVRDLRLPSAPLYRLADAARFISERTGVSQPEAVGFLLADRRPVLPWIQFRRVDRSYRPGFSLSIEVGTLGVRPDELAAAYEQVQKRNSGLQLFSAHDAGDLFDLLSDERPEPYVRRRTAGKTQALVAFVDKYKREHSITGAMPPGTWAEVCERFNEEQDEYTPLTPESARVQYWRATRS